MLEDPLSTSNMGTVYLARQERPSRYVAVKVIHRDLASHPQDWQVFLTRFQHEADATATLDHANIVPIYEFGETGDLAYLVMPYFPEGSLATRLDELGPMPLQQTVQYVEQIASALDYAHARGIIHRDVKPSNMLLHPDGRILLADFGIARPLQLRKPPSDPDIGSEGAFSAPSLTQAGAAMGTPEYMAPEQVRAEAPTPETDQYGLGIATYELLCGQTPFAGGDVPTVLRRHLRTPPPSLFMLRPGLPARVEGVIFWALAKDPADRPASAGQFATALRVALETAPEVGGGRSGAGHSLKGTFPVVLDSTAAGQESSSSSRSLPDLTLPLRPSALPHISIEPHVTLDAMHDDQSSVTVGPGGISRQGVLVPEGADIGYANRSSPGAPQWPVPQTGPDRKTATAAVVGLAVSLVALIIVAALVVYSVQSALTSPSGAPRRIAGSVPTATAPIPASQAAGALTSGLAVNPTQVTLGCQSTQSVTLELTNAGPEVVSWAAQTSSFHQSSLDVQPASGTLAAGTSQAIIVNVTSGNSNNAGPSTIQFAIVSGQQTENLAQVIFATASCGSGGD
jgi:serine/threonine protein kinase